MTLLSVGWLVLGSILGLGVGIVLEASSRNGLKKL